MAVPSGDMEPEAAAREVTAAIILFNSLKELGLLAATAAAKPVGSRDANDKDRLVKYLILYRRVKALVGQQ